MADKHRNLFKFKSTKTTKSYKSETEKNKCLIEEKTAQNDNCKKSVVKNKKQSEKSNNATITKYFLTKEINSVVQLKNLQPGSSCKEIEKDYCVEVGPSKKRKHIECIELLSSSQSSDDEIMEKKSPVKKNYFEDLTSLDKSFAKHLHKKLLHQQKCDDIKIEGSLTVFVRRKSHSFINFLQNFCAKKSNIEIDIAKLIRQVQPEKDIKCKYVIITDTSFDYDKASLAVNILKFGLDGQLYIIHIEDMCASDLPNIFRDWKIECQQIIIHLAEHPIVINNYIGEFFQSFKQLSSSNKLFICIAIEINNASRHCNFPYRNCDLLVDLDGLKNCLQNRFIKTFQLQNKHSTLVNPYIKIIHFLSEINPDSLVEKPNLKELVNKHIENLQKKY
ncbi:unnamed protein product [Dimorphilus gyrociliatus]|uniref:Uncharacterized protein n=1 Tax=Dimorphilus gyrociliatus TaxID=2664684 RepID=A0A7I8VAN8_9ANNE|nr:unnamed protein product [Dimorphilus gyrociliatus]